MAKAAPVLPEFHVQVRVTSELRLIIQAASLTAALEEAAKYTAYDLITPDYGELDDAEFEITGVFKG